MKISKHAYDRAKQRFGMDERAFRLFVSKAMGQGTKVKDLTGKLWQYAKKYDDSDDCLKNSIFYKMRILIIKNDTVVTCLYIPTRIIEDYYANLG